MALNEETIHPAAQARFDRGQRNSAEETAALAHWSRWGSDGYPITKVKGGWVLNHPIVDGTPVCKTKKEATQMWETAIDILIDTKGLFAHQDAQS